MPTIEEIPDDGENPQMTPRFRLNEDLKRDAKGAVRTVVEGLNLAATMTQNVPYLGIVSGALTAFMKVQDEVDMLRSDWKTIMNIARQIQANLDFVREKFKDKEDEALPKDLAEPLQQLEKCLADATKTINACKADSKSWTDRALLHLNRGELSGEVKQCREAMQAALDFFNTRVNVINMLALDKLVDKRVASSAVPVVIISSAKSPPPPPEIFYGREREVNQILDLVLHTTPARVAVLGPGGIGKTSIALTVLHSADVKERYGARRFFVSCETVTSTEGVKLELLTTFGLILDPKQNIQPQQALLNHLRGLSNGLLCVDNLETIWDAETRATETLLTSLASFPQLALLVTTRGSRRPMHVAWTHPYLPPIVPLSLDAASQAWKEICEVHDEYSVKLIEAIDCMPLAVALLANLAQNESPKVLWERWERENLDVLHTHNTADRLSNIEYSIELSLRGPRLRDEATVMQVLQIICILPQGLLEARISAFTDAYTETLPGFSSSISLLRQCSLVYLSESGFLRVLSPIRHYIETRYALPDQLIYPLAKIYCDLVDHEVPGYGAMNFPYAQDVIRPEIGNISAILMYCLNHELHRYQERILRAIISFAQLCQTMSFRDVGLLIRALDFLPEFPGIAIDLLKVLGLLHYYSNHYFDTISTFSKAVRLSQAQQKLSEEAWCLHMLGDAYRCLGQFEMAKSTLVSAIAIYDRRLSETYSELDAKIVLGEVYINLGQLHAANTLLQSIQQVATDTSAHNMVQASNYQNILGHLYLAQNELDKAEQILLLSVESSETFAGTLWKANSFTSLGKLYIESERYDDARRMLQDAKNLYDTIGDLCGTVEACTALGRLNMQTGDLAVAQTYLQSAMQLYTSEVDDLYGKALMLSYFGRLFYLQKNYGEAQSKLDCAIEMFSAMPHPFGHGEALFWLGEVHRKRDELQEALDCFRQAIKLFERAENPRKADSVRLEMKDLIARLRATGGCASPATTEGSIHSARTRLANDGDDSEETYSTAESEAPGSVHDVDDTEAREN